MCGAGVTSSSFTPSSRALGMIMVEDEGMRFVLFYYFAPFSRALSEPCPVWESVQDQIRQIRQGKYDNPESIISTRENVRPILPPSSPSISLWCII